MLVVSCIVPALIFISFFPIEYSNVKFSEVKGASTEKVLCFGFLMNIFVRRQVVSFLLSLDDSRDNPISGYLSREVLLNQLSDCFYISLPFLVLCVDINSRARCH